MAVLTPCSASFSAIPRPMPRELPVTSAVFPRRDISTSFVLSGGADYTCVTMPGGSPLGEWPRLDQLDRFLGGRVAGPFTDRRSANRGQPFFSCRWAQINVVGMYWMPALDSPCKFT